MLYVTIAQIWTSTIFFPLSYLTLCVSVLLYVLPVITQWRHRKGHYRAAAKRTVRTFEFVNALNIFWINTVLVSLLIVVNLSWVMPATAVWFGHLALTNFSHKMYFVVVSMYLTLILVRSSTVYLSARTVYDSFLTNLQFMYWSVLLFYINTLFSALFVLEVLSTLVFALVIACNYSTSFAYRNTSLSFGQTFHLSTPHTHLQSLLYYFWVSMMAALTLFMACLYTHIKLLTTDWFLLETVLHYVLSVGSVSEVIRAGVTLFMLMVCIFLKCGVAPLFYWKPTFFRGLPYGALFFYITFFYMFVFLFILHMLTVGLSDLIAYYPAVLLIFVITGVLTLLFILCEAFYIKPFLALSSALNSILVLTAVSSSHHEAIVLWL